MILFDETEVSCKWEGIGQPATGTMKEWSFAENFGDILAFRPKYRYNVSKELLHDLKAVHGVDAEQELANILAEELKFEIDKAILNKKRQIYADS